MIAVDPPQARRKQLPAGVATEDGDVSGTCFQSMAFESFRSTKVIDAGSTISASAAVRRWVGDRGENVLDVGHRSRARRLTFSARHQVPHVLAHPSRGLRTLPGRPT